MSKKPYTLEEIIEKLQRGKELRVEGRTKKEVCKELDVSYQLFLKWENEYGEMTIEQAERLKSLEKDNERLAKLKLGIQKVIHEYDSKDK